MLYQDMTRDELLDTIEKLMEIKEIQERLIDNLESQYFLAQDRMQALTDRIHELEETQQWAVTVCYADGKTAGVADSPEKAVELGLKTWRAATLGSRQDITKVCCLNQHREVVFYYEG